MKSKMKPPLKPRAADKPDLAPPGKPGRTPFLGLNPPEPMEHPLWVGGPLIQIAIETLGWAELERRSGLNRGTIWKWVESPTPPKAVDGMMRLLCAAGIEPEAMWSARRKRK